VLATYMNRILFSSCGSENHDRDFGEILSLACEENDYESKITQTAIVFTEIMTPFRDAVTFINHKSF
jgi:hypothetical protein